MSGMPPEAGRLQELGPLHGADEAEVRPVEERHELGREKDQDHVGAEVSIDFDIAFMTSASFFIVPAPRP